MLNKLVLLKDDYSQLKQWEKRSYQVYRIDKIQNEILSSSPEKWKNIIKQHILNGDPKDFGASCIDIYLVAFVAENYSPGKDSFFDYIKDSGISDKENTAQAIWQVGKGDGVFLGLLNNDGKVRDWDFFTSWITGDFYQEKVHIPDQQITKIKKPTSKIEKEQRFTNTNNLIGEILSKYHSLSIQDNHHRFKSWEHCYSFFYINYLKLEDDDVFDQGCLHLAFYLASWGMLRGSSFLLQKDYKIHSFFLKDVVMNPENHKFFGENPNSLVDIEDMERLISETKRAYQENINEINGIKARINVTDTLASKILLGVYGNVPAYDRYFKDALTLFGIRTQFDKLSLKELVDFYNLHQHGFEKIKIYSAMMGLAIQQ